MKPIRNKLLLKLLVFLLCLICSFIGLVYSSDLLRNEPSVIIQRNYYVPGFIKYSFLTKKDVHSNDLMAIDAKFYSRDGRLVKHSQMNRQYLNGTIRYFYGSGELFAVEAWENNYREGETIFYYRNGNLLAVENWVASKRQGITKYYYENGILEKEITYKNDLYDGEIKEYSSSGKMLSSSFWKRGKLINKR